MKLVVYEIKKVISKRVFLIILAFCFAINIFLLYYSQISNENNVRIEHADEYVSMIGEYKNLSVDKAIEKVNQELLVHNIYGEMNRLAYITDEDELKFVTEELQQYKTDYPDAYKKAEKISRMGEKQWELQFLYDISNQLDYIKSYPDFIGQMRQRADLQSSVSVFGNEDSFSYNNLYKTADDYKHLKNINLSIGNSNALTATTEYNLTDIILIAVVFFVCIFLFCYERDKGLYNLVKSSKYGRLRTIISKLLVLFAFSALLSIVFTTGNYITNVILYGADDLGRSVQSISAFRNCTIAVSAGQYLVIYTLMKIAGITAVASILAMIFIIFSNPAIMYIVSVGVVAAEYFLYTLIDSTAVFNYPKYINIFYILNNSFVGEYLNLNIFSKAVTAFPLVLTLFAVVFIICSSVACIIFCNKKQIKKSSILSRYIEKLRNKFLKIKGSVSIAVGETYKFLVQNKMVFFIILILGYSVINSIGTVGYRYLDISDRNYKAYMEYLEGDLTLEKVNFLNREEEYFNNLKTRLVEIDNDTTLSENAKSALSASINSVIEIKGTAFDRVMSQYNRLISLQKQGIKPQFIDENIYSNFVSNSIREWKNLVLFILALIISLPVIFTVEYKNGMINLIRPTRNGKTKLFVHKLFISYVVMVITFFAIYSPYIIRFVSTYGTESIGTSLQCLYNVSDSALTVISATIFKLCGYVAVGVFAVSLINFIAVKFKNNLIVMLVSSITLLVPTIAIYSAESLRFGYNIVENNIIAVSITMGICVLLSILLIRLSRRIFTEE